MFSLLLCCINFGVVDNIWHILIFVVNRFNFFLLDYFLPIADNRFGIFQPFHQDHSNSAKYVQCDSRFYFHHDYQVNSHGLLYNFMYNNVHSLIYFLFWKLKYISFFESWNICSKQIVLCIIYPLWIYSIITCGSTCSDGRMPKLGDRK